MTTTPARHSRSFAIGLVAVLIAALALVPDGASAKATAANLKLSLGQEVFWAGEEIEFAQVPDPASCGIAGECFEYELHVEQGKPATRLRVALSATLPEQEGDFREWPDLPGTRSPEMVFDVQLFAPGTDPQTGEPVTKDSTFDEKEKDRTGHAVELFVGGNDHEAGQAAPAGGTWTVRVIPESVVDMAFRMRAKLEAPASDPTGLAFPNLRVIPPFELGFPVTTTGFGPGVAGVPGSRSCMATEITEPAEVDALSGVTPHADDVPELCLRYSMGLENAGAGPLRLLMQSSADPVRRARDFFGVAETPLIQRVCNFKGEECQGQGFKEGLTSRFHVRHAHFHYENAYFFELFEIPEGWRRGDPAPKRKGDPAPKLRAGADGRKLGVQPTNETLADWGRFYQLDRGFFGKEEDNSRCGNGGACGEMRLQAGWGDVYEWNRDGNYVDFPQSKSLPGMPKEGFYVLRGTADVAKQIAEGDETDNVSYAFIEVSKNGKVELVERGYGTDPWDPTKKPLKASP